MTSTLADWKAKVAEKMMAPKSMDCVSIEDEPESARQMEKEEAETLAMESSASAPSKPAAEEPKMPSSKDQAKTYMRRRIRFPK